jgi:hypothetical protein
VTHSLEEVWLRDGLLAISDKHRRDLLFVRKGLFPLVGIGGAPPGPEKEIGPGGATNTTEAGNDAALCKNDPFTLPTCDRRWSERGRNHGNEEPVGGPFTFAGTAAGDAKRNPAVPAALAQGSGATCLSHYGTAVCYPRKAM